MEQAWPSIWLLIRSWLTPAVLFLLLNFIIGTIALTSKSLHAHRHHDDAAAGDAHIIVRTASSAFHRLRSLSLSRLGYGDFIVDPAIEAVSDSKSDEINSASQKTEVLKKKDEQIFCRSQSETLPPPPEEGESHARMMKSASERSTRGSFEKKRAVKKEKAVEEEVKGGVDARADDFINRFRQQLQLQRLDSLLKYKEMLNRGI